MNTHRLVVVGAAICLLAAGPALAQSQVIADRAEQRAAERPVPRAAGRGANQPSVEEMDTVMEFMREHSPNRVRALESLPEESAARRGVAAFVMARYRSLQAVKEEDAKLYEISVKQVEIEDELYGLLAPARTAAEREKLRERIRAMAMKQVEINLSEREQRLSRLRESLQREERKLESDRSQSDVLRDVRTNLLIQEGPAALRREMVRRGLREDTRRDGRPVPATTAPVEK